MNTDRLYVSLTSYKPRFPFLASTLESLLDQTISPDEIYLWIYREELAELKKNLPARISRHIRIYGCNQLFSYKKILPLLAREPNADIVTADDDVTYPSNWLEGLISKKLENPGNPVAHRIHRITLNEDWSVKPYNEWNWCLKYDTEPSRLNFQTGVGGVLYPRGSLPHETLNVKRAMRFCSSTDDIWLYFMIRINNRSVVGTGSEMKFIPHENSQSTTLWKRNVKERINDYSFARLTKIYGPVWKKST